MKKLYLFNPEHDLALANWDANYIPPALIRQITTDLALLPMWYAENGASVLAPAAHNLAFLQEMQQLFPLQVSLMTEAEDFSEVTTIIPWGWNAVLHKRLLKLGVAEKKLPSLKQLETLRQFSHRQKTVDLLSCLQLDSSFCGKSVYLEDIEKCRTFVESKECCLLKAPWSGSGKGLNWCKGEFTTQIQGWCAGMIKQQGGVVGEPVYDKVGDFAMEFHSDGKGKVAFVGNSLFHTTGNGSYEANWLMADEDMENLLEMYADSSTYQSLKLRLVEELSLRYGKVYEGYMGVDMMFANTKTGYLIHPCVEVNLRMNMGVVSRLIYDRYIQSGCGGMFHITYYPDRGEALRAHEELKEIRPLLLEDGKIVSGYLSLVPIHKNAHYHAWITVDR